VLSAALSTEYSLKDGESPFLRKVVKHLSDDSLTSQNTVILVVTGVRTSTRRTVDGIWIKEWIYWTFTNSNYSYL
jgi:hypothetical protein